MSDHEEWVARSPGRINMSDWAKAKLAEAFDTPAVKNYLELRKEAEVGNSSQVSMMFNFGDGKPGSRSDMTCDKCGAFTPFGLVLWPIPYFATQQDADAVEWASLSTVMETAVLLVTLGLCQKCALEEHLDQVNPTIRDFHE